MEDCRPTMLVCKDCREKFTWKVSEQIFYAERNLVPPKRCPECRIIMRRKEVERLREARDGS